MSDKDAPSNPFSRKRSIKRPSISGLVRSGAGMATTSSLLFPAHAAQEIEFDPLSHREIPVSLLFETEPGGAGKRHQSASIEIEHGQTRARIDFEVAERHEH